MLMMMQMNQQMRLSLILLFSLVIFSCFGQVTFAQLQRLHPNEADALRQIATTLGATLVDSTDDPCQSGKLSISTANLTNYENSITCSYTDGTFSHVTSLKLKSMSLQGRLPPELVKLTFLREIDLYQNYFSGELPKEWASLGHLNNISLGATGISGEIPKEWGYFANLTYLSLVANQLSGTIPEDLGNLVSLTYLALSSNQFTGSLPKTLVNLANLMDFTISDNNFSGTVPEFIGRWPKLRGLEMYSSGLEGPISPTIFALGNLNDLRITDMIGPKFDFPELNNMKMQYLVLRNLNMFGSIPAYIWNMSDLQLLDLTFNKLKGEISISTIWPTNIFLSGNMLNGTITESFLDNLSKNKNLSKRKGGLGVGRVLDKNRGFLAKWVWRFGREEDSLWKRTICAKYGVEAQSLQWNWNYGYNASNFIKVVFGLFLEGSESARILNEGMKLIVGRGNKISFWDEVWRDRLPLKLVYPRIYALAVNIGGKIEDYGSWEGETWKWDIKLRRRVFDWELEVWADFSSRLEEVNLRRNKSDSLVWSFCPKGMFSVSSFRRCVDEIRDDRCSELPTMWYGFCPPKVEIFVWQLLYGRIMVRGYLNRLYISGSEDLSCPMCGGLEETVDHLFLQCSWARKLWCVCMGWWSVEGCINKNVKEWFEGWVGLCPVLKMKRVWMTIFFVVVWVIWEARNNKVFKNVTPVMEEYVDLARFRTAWWFKHHGRGSDEPITALVQNLEFCCFEEKSVKKILVRSWIPPLGDELKFNVDGSCNLELGRAGIGGVLRDSKGAVLCSFSAFVGKVDAPTAELMAVYKACALSAAKESLRGRKISFESDSREVIGWVNDEEFGNLQLVEMIFDIRSKLGSLVNSSLKFVPRSANELADGFAKKGLELNGEEVFWNIL